MNKIHTPVLVKEVLEYLNIRSGSKIIDATINGGGHTMAILKKFNDVSVLGVEWDPVIFSSIGGSASGRKNLKPYDGRLVIVNDSYVNLKKIASDNKFEPDGILFDLGLSSWHYEESGRGFSFKRNEILDMRFNPEVQKEKAVDIINKYEERNLKDLISSLGEESFASSIAKNIIRKRKEKPIIMTEDLVKVIEESVPEWYKHRKIHFATKTFQALRVKVNDEMDNIEKGIEGAIDTLKQGGRLAVISFQGLEDKTVKNIFRKKAKDGTVKFVTKKTIKPTWEETKENPRARSAKMKIIEKI